MGCVCMCVCVCGIGSSHNFRLFLAVKSCNFLNLPQSLFFMTLTFLKIFCKISSIGFWMFSHGLSQLMYF